MGKINMLVGHRIIFLEPHPIKNKNILGGRRFNRRGPQLARGPRVADPWFKVNIVSITQIDRFGYTIKQLR